MQVKLTGNENGTWNLWATKDGSDDAPPVYAAWARSSTQIGTLLRSILTEEREGTAPAPACGATPDRLDGAAQRVQSEAKSLALYTMLTTLDGWIEGQQANHEALDHRGEIEDCWTRFTPEDIRNMINDAAREVGVGAFPLPKTPREDRS